MSAMKASHILVPEESTCQSIRAELAQDLSRFGELAAKHSLCPSGKSLGGSLGTFQRGQMVPAFEAVVEGLEEAAISDCFRTDFGYHIVQREKP
jgi:peptidyl-prolyl cis-trans isomerase C